MKRKTKAWLAIADSDLRAATSLFDKQHYAHAVFLSHQAVEKTLKALGSRGY
jgi:HEPN domain-containing protein